MYDWSNRIQLRVELSPRPLPSQSKSKSKSKMMNMNLFLLSVAAMVSVAGATTAVNLRTAGDFVILAKAGITNVPGGVITGNIGVSPIAASAMTGFDLIMDSSNEFSTSAEVTGSAYAPNYMSPTGTKLTTAVSDMLTAYNDAAARPVTSGSFQGKGAGTSATYTNLGAGEIGGLTLTPGLLGAVKSKTIIF
ncbi:putative ice-binding protein [Fragilariopsis cylindrus CCMP1102]|uniref:Putative ice-binding protein n=1 Tax=Fragilariopsis cylindrus CCMP1102 TaxID=635003 RepID=A0A1E7FQE9_9STRA|nr:putative ice-binding protein [Fragilariopsis cylindrus CCMP1102]|eukprot:OEU20399.1 putative ice-binding protein [Fragilariopsis cylindrus CCMP1102]